MSSYAAAGAAPHAMMGDPVRTTPAQVSPVVPALNTILAVRDHAPAEILELEQTIVTLRQRLDVAYARKRLLEQLVAVIRDADPATQHSPMPPISLVR